MSVPLRVSGDLLSIAAANGRSPRKRAVLNAAITLFAERGYDRVGVREIGEYLDQTGPSLYRHYKSKSALLTDAVSLVIETMIEQLREIASLAASPSDRLVAAVRFHASFALHHRVYLRVYYREARHLQDAARSRHRRRAATYLGLWIQLMLDAGVAADRDEAEVLYGMLMAMLNLGIPAKTGLSTEMSLELVTDRALAMIFAP